MKLSHFNIIIIIQLLLFTTIGADAIDWTGKKPSQPSSSSIPLSPSSTSLTDNSLPSKDAESVWSCEQLDYCSDRMGFEAIKWLHNQLDDDDNGAVDIAESDEFLRDELQYENGYERQKVFHGNDKHISVDELWKSWKMSDVRNWTVDETLEWLITSVELPQYVEHFQNNAVDGMALPRLASNTHYFNILGINNPIHKQKIALKAMDVVLFGAPKHHNYFKDALLVFSLIIAIGGFWFAYVQHKYSQTHLKKMMRDLDSLQKAEEQLTELQKELDKAREEQQNVVMEKVFLEKKLKENASQIVGSLSYTELNDLARVEQLEDELKRTRQELNRAETALTAKAWSAPRQLQQWLQFTHELEIRNYNVKRAAAEMQLQGAKEGCEKLRKKRSTLVGAFRVAHGNSIDDVDNRILQAKAALSDVTKDLQERLHRWKQIEMYCQFPIVHNSGLLYLESVLYGNVNGTNSGVKRSPSDDTVVDDDGTSISTVEQLVQKSLAMMMSPVSLPLSQTLFNNKIICIPSYTGHDPNSPIIVCSRRDSLISNRSDISRHVTALPENSTFNINDVETSSIGDGSSLRLGSSGIAPAYDRASMLSLNIASGFAIQTKQSVPSNTTASVYRADTVSDDEIEDEFIEDLQSPVKTMFIVGDNTTPSRDSPTKSLASYSGQSKTRGIMVKSYSQDDDSGIQSPQNSKICHSESCTELQTQSPVSNVTRSNSDSPNNKTGRINKLSALIKGSSQTTEVLDEETASTDSGSINESAKPDKKRSFFNLRKRKATKL